MSTPAPPAKPAGKSSRRQPPRRHQPYKRTSAVIDERPDGKPVIFGYGRHLTNREKDRVRHLIAYSALGLIIAVSVIIIAGAAIYQNIIYPNQSVASVNGQGISRHDHDLLTNYFTGEASLQGTTLSQDPATLATAQLQKSLLAIQTAKKIGIVATISEANAQLTKATASSVSQVNFQHVLQVTGLSRDDYMRLVMLPQIVRTKVMDYLTRNEPKVAEQWHYARIQVATQKAALQILNSLVKGTSFAKLAKSKSLDTTTKAQGGDLGWLRASDTSVDSLLPTFLPTLRAMEKSGTQYRIMHSGTQWYVLDFLGHQPKRALSTNQVQQDQLSAYTQWYNQAQSTAVFSPPLPASLLSSGQ